MVDLYDIDDFYNDYDEDEEVCCSMCGCLYPMYEMIDDMCEDCHEDYYEDEDEEYY